MQDRTQYRTTLIFLAAVVVVLIDFILRSARSGSFGARMVLTPRVMLHARAILRRRAVGEVIFGRRPCLGARTIVYEILHLRGPILHRRGMSGH